MADVRVLVVDDEPSIVRMVKRVLTARGIGQVDRGKTAAEAMALARRDPDLALVDVRLGAGEPSGVELVANLRATGYRGYVCMLTGDEDPETMLRALLAGADDYLLKRCCAIGPDVEEMLARRRSPPAASKVVRRAEEKLGVGNRFQLVRLLTVLSGFGVRARAAAEGTGT